MENFRVHYRTKDGRCVCEDVTARSREDLFCVLQGRGIQAVKVETASACPCDGTFTRVGIRGWKWLAFAIVAASGLAVGVFCMADKGGGGGPPKTSASKTARRASPLPFRAKRSIPPARTNPPPHVYTPPVPTQPQLQRAETNTTGAVIEDYILPDGTTMRRITPPKPVWDNAADQLIAMTISIEPGAEAPPLPAGVGDREFLRALKKPIAINADDPADLQRLKRQVRETRNEILEAMAKTGKSFEEVLNDHRNAMNEGTALWKAAQKGYNSAKATATQEELDEYAAKVNALLEEKGARPLATGQRRRGVTR